MTASPCINVCKMEGDFCQGCWRTLAEISVWSTASEEQKKSILVAVDQRRAACAGVAGGAA